MTTLDDLLSGPPPHLERYAPPWARARRTVCGRPLDDVAAWLSFDEAKALIAKLGNTRARLVFCQSCLGSEHAMNKPGTWDAKAAEIVADYARRGAWTGAPSHDETRFELLALGRLVEAHRDEYDAMVTAYLTDEVTARREAKSAGRTSKRQAPRGPRPL